MTQPIDRETAIALAKEAGFKASIGQTVDDKYHPDRNAIGKSVPVEWVQRFYELAVAHSRKDAEPVDIRAAMKKAFYLGQTYWQQADSEYVSQQNKSDATKAKFDALLEETVINAAHPPEADKLLRQALEVWDNITGATRTTINAPAAMGSIRTYLEGKNA